MDTEFLTRDAYRLGVKKTEHDRFAIITRDEGGAYLNLTLTFCNAEAAILRPIRDVELHPREELDARVELVVGGGVEEIRVGQDTVNAEAQESPLFSRLKVDVRRAQCKRSRDDDFKDARDTVKLFSRRRGVERLLQSIACHALLRKSRERFWSESEDSRPRLRRER